MPDLLAGSIIKALDFTPTVEDLQTTAYSFTIASYGVTVSSGSYAGGVVFVAPTTGRVEIEWCGEAVSSAASPVAACFAPAVREGGTIGSGTSFLAAGDDNIVYVRGNVTQWCSRAYLVEGLTPGDTYNVRMEHRMSGAGTGTLTKRSLKVRPAT